MYQLHPQRRTIFAGVAIFTPAHAEKLVEITKVWWDNVKEDEGIIQAVTCGPDGTHLLLSTPTGTGCSAHRNHIGNPCIAVAFFYNGSEEEGRQNFKAFFDLGMNLSLARFSFITDR